MFVEEFKLNNASGLHARPASQLAALCKKFPNDIRIAAGEAVVNPKSVMEILMAGMKKGTDIRIEVDGDDEQKVGEEIVLFLSNLTE